MNHIFQKVYAELRITTNCRLRIVKELNGVKNRIQRWIKIYFPEYTKVFGSFEAVSSMIVLETAPLPTDIISLGAEGIDKAWRV